MELDEVDKVLEDAFNLVRGLCTGERSWTMSVPVRDTDSDEILTRALAAASELVHQMRGLEK